jgi:hypothetical protein
VFDVLPGPAGDVLVVLTGDEAGVTAGGVLVELPGDVPGVPACGAGEAGGFGLPPPHPYMTEIKTAIGSAFSFVFIFGLFNSIDDDDPLKSGAASESTRHQWQPSEG